MSTTPAIPEPLRATRPGLFGNLMMWMLTFLMIPIAGYVGTLIVGRVDSLLSALLGGAFVGLVVGFVQALVSRRRLPLLRWTLASAIGMSVGVAAGTSAVAYETPLDALALSGLITGAFVGLAQTLALPATARFRWLWLPLTAALWPLAWTLTTLAGVRVEEQFIVFGASGSFVYTLLSGLALQLLIPQPATRVPYEIRRPAFG
jgi:hypothetical protein